MWEESTISSAGSDQISAESDALIQSFDIGDQNPKRGDVNSLPSPLTLLAAPISPPIPRRPTTFGLVLVPRYWASVSDVTG
jgi:hypothetical protein